KEAQAVARTLLDLRSLVQGENHWQTDDAGRLVGTLEKIAALSADAQAEAAKAKKAARAASQLERQLKFAKAAPLRRQELEIYQRHLGEAHPDTVTSYNKLAFNLNAQGKYGEAEPIFQKALASRRQALGEAHPDTAKSYNNLAANLYSQGKYRQAEPLCR